VIASMRAPKKAVPQLLMEKLGSTAALILRTTPSTTNVKRPKVKILMGRVTMSKKGRIKMLAIPMTIAVIRAEKKLPT